MVKLNVPKVKLTNKVKVTNKVSGKNSNLVRFKLIPSKETQAFLDLLGEKKDIFLQQALRAGMISIVTHATERAAVLAPILDGYLRASLKANVDEVEVVPTTTGGPDGEINPSNPIRKINEEQTDIPPDPRRRAVVGIISSSMPYAWRMHEDQYNLGPVSVVQPGDMPEGPVGNKFVTRVADFHYKTYQKWLNERVEFFVDEIGKEAGIK